MFFADFFAQGVDEEVDGVTFYFFAPAVDFVFEVAAGMDGAGAGNQCLQDGEFFVAEGDVVILSGDFHLIIGRVEADDAVGEFRCGLPVAAAQNGVDAGAQFRHDKGFDNVVVGTAVQPRQAAVEVVACG